jgi:hypothetical protein
MTRALDRDKLLAAFDDIGRAAATASTTLQIVVYGGSALILASNFRFATEDADVAPLEKPWPEWLQRAVERITAETGWAEDWFNEHLSPIADPAVDHLEFGTFPQRRHCTGSGRVRSFRVLSLGPEA